MRRSTVLAAFLLASGSRLAAQTPSAPWRTFETIHFRVHYPAPFEAWAKRATARIESIHARVTEYVGYEPRQRVDVLVEDPAAAANGVAFPFLDRPVIVLWTQPPEAESSIGFFQDWPDLLLTHEMTHIVHLLRPRSQSLGLLARFSPLPIGPVLRKSPRWVIEGYATLVEGALTGSGRPQGSFRAMVMRRFAMEGKLPDYRELSSIGGWLRGSAPYLVGSTYLEWLEQREGKGSLQRLWERLASKRGGFAAAFEKIFGDSPEDLYDRFRAETTARAIAEETRLAAAGLVEGEQWQSLKGGTTSPQVSPDGSLLLARRERRAGRAEIAIWQIAGKHAERKPGEEAEPASNAGHPHRPPAREPRWRLPSVDGRATTLPRWMPDGRRVLFSRKTRDSEGVLRPDLFVWSPEEGSIVRLTRRADVAMADPVPDGESIVAVQNRFGSSRLVRVRVATGAVEPLRPDLENDDPWRVWIHPRVSPDGRRVAALVHAGGRWRVLVFGIDGPGSIDLGLPGSAIGPPAWSPEGSLLYVATDASGIWNVEAVPAAGGVSRLLTRVTGGAFSPAPAPDGKSIFFLAATAKGFDLRRLEIGPREIAALPPPPDRPAAFPILPPPAVEVARPSEASVAPSHPYRVFDSHVTRLHVSESLGPSGETWQFGIEGSDVVGRWNWLAAGSVGSVSGPRGGSVAAAYRRFPVALRAHLFWAEERPGSQKVLERPDFDQERRGGFFEASFERAFDRGSLRAGAGIGTSRVEPLGSSSDGRLSRTVGAVHAEGVLERSRGQRGVRFDWDLTGSAGSTGGEGWRQGLVGGRVTALAGGLRLRLAGHRGETSGDTTRFDLFALGGAPSSILPEGLDRNRYFEPALPADVQVGRKIEHWRAELSPRGLPMSLFYERARAWSDSASKPPAVRVWGAELRFDESFLPLPVAGSFDFYAGVARIESRRPSFAGTRLYSGIVYHP